MSDPGDWIMRRSGGSAIIQIPMSEVHALRVALNPCPCSASKSTFSASIRDRLEKGLARLEAQK